ncbi:MAG: hypothetical protein Q9182_005095 [Xanthomendoza sp. 2 TL-2023]
MSTATAGAVDIALRAGENMLALMSTVLPLLDKEDSDIFLSKLFESCNVSADRTPGFDQLKQFCDTVLPLARKMAFKDHVYKYSMVHCRLQADRTLFKLLTQRDSTDVLSYHGWQGAAWVIAYARHVLGLPVCVMRTTQDLVPFSGDSRSWKVFVYASETPPMCQLLTKDDSGGSINPKAQGELTSDRWMIELGDIVNLRALHLQTGADLDHALVEFTRSLAVMFIRQFVDGAQKTYLQRRNYRALPMRTYTQYCLPQIEDRGLEILETMGFARGSGFNAQEHTWTDLLQVHYGGQAAINIVPCRKLLGTSLAEESSVPGMDANHQRVQFSAEGKRVVYFTTMVAEMASLLAFFNWDDKLRLVSTRSLETRLKNDIDNRWEEKPFKRSLALSKNNTFNDWDVNGPGFVQGLCRDLLNLVTGYDPATPELANSIALEHQGIVLASAAAGCYSIDFEAVFFNFEAGHISIDGARRPRIAGATLDQSQVDPLHMGLLDYTAMDEHPRNAFPNIGVASEAWLEDESIVVLTRTSLQESVIDVKEPTLSEDSLVHAFVTEPCRHSYHTAVLRELSEYEIVRWGLDLGRGREREPSHTFDDPEDRTLEPRDAILDGFLQAVDQNPIGQWLSVRGDTMHKDQDKAKYSSVLQRNMCINCAIKLVKNRYKENCFYMFEQHWYIIPAKLAGE